jgi:hypothetical protein
MTQQEKARQRLEERLSEKREKEKKEREKAERASNVSRKISRVI